MAGLGRCRPSGYSLAEMTIAVAIVAILAAALLPTLSSNEPHRLELAAEEVATALRFAVSESRRIGSNGLSTYVLVDGKTNAGKLRVYVSNASAQIPPVSGTSVVNDPLTKRALVVDPVTANSLQGITLAPPFKVGAQPWGQLLISQNPTQFRVFDGVGNDKGLLQANSGVLLSLGANTVTVSFNELTGMVTRP